MRRNRRPAFDSHRFAKVVATAGGEITEGIKRAALISDHHGTSGGIRETGLRDFLRQLLPDRYYIGTGFTFDAQDNQSRQLDVVIALEPPLARVFESDGICYLPCEAVLAAIEVKKTLTAVELKRVLANAGSVRSLHPYGNQRFTSARTGGAKLDAGHHRCAYGVVAIDSDLAAEDWAQREWDRLKRLAAESEVEPSYVDRMLILDRGILNAVEGSARDGKDAVEQMTTEWFIHLLNHLEREAGRRPTFDPDIYTKGRPWIRLQ